MSNFWETAAKWGTVALKAAEAVTRHQEVVRLVEGDLQTSMNFITQMVHSLPPNALDAHETEFLNIASTSIVDPAQRRRAMQLYAWMKIEEYARFGNQFRGFG